MSYEIKKLVWSKYFIGSNPGLRAYFRKSIVGNMEDYRTPFGKGRSVDYWLNQWRKFMLSKLGNYNWIAKFEDDMYAKCGPLSIQAPFQERLPKILEYFTLIDKQSVPIHREAIDLVVKEFSGLHGLRLRNAVNTTLNMRLNTNSGCPRFTRRNRVISEAIELAVNSLYKYLACILGWRGQEGGPDFSDVKQRIVWMYAFHGNIRELMLYQPFIEGVQKLELIPAYVSKECVNRRLTKLFDTKNQKDLVICTDFTSFDQHFNTHMQNAARQVFFDLGIDKSWLLDVFPIKYNVPLILPNETVIYGHHGMGSGSGGTNADESISHRCLQYEAALFKHQKLNINSMAYGDDGVLSYPGITAEDVVKCYTKHGLDMNISKQHASTNTAVVLRCVYHINYRKNGVMMDVYSTCRALNRLLRQERFYDPEKWSKEMVTLRALSILENCHNHPLFHELVNFVMKLDKYRLGLGIPGFYSKLHFWASKAKELQDDFLGYTKTLQDTTLTGIDKWDVVQYIRKEYHV